MTDLHNQNLRHPARSEHAADRANYEAYMHRELDRQRKSMRLHNGIERLWMVICWTVIVLLLIGLFQGFVMLVRWGGGQ